MERRKGTIEGHVPLSVGKEDWDLIYILSGLRIPGTYLHLVPLQNKDTTLTYLETSNTKLPLANLSYCSAQVENVHHVDSTR